MGDAEPHEKCRSSDAHMRKRIAMDLDWQDVQLFLAIAESGSLSKAARLLRVGQPTMSRRLAELEQRLGYPLFNRQVAGITLTPDAERWLEPARKMAEWAGELARAAGHGEQAGPRGVVRVTAAPGVAFDFVAGFATAVRERYPALCLEVLSTVQLMDLGRGEADLALRSRAPVSRELVLITSVTIPNAVLVAPTYAARLPKRPKLTDLDWVAWAPPFQDLAPNPQLASLIPDFRPVFTSDNFLVQWRACAAGMGAMVFGRVKHRFSLPVPFIPLSIDLGEFATSTLHLVCARSALGIPRVRAVAELLETELKQIGG